jgi:ferredoxin-thioredoxin reductase catalytic chain
MVKGQTKTNDLESVARRIESKIRRYAAKSPYRLNPDAQIVDYVIEGLARNQIKYGSAYCTCKIRQGNETDKNIICPCLSLDEEIAQNGMCGCALFIEAEEPKTVPSDFMIVYEPVSQRAQPKVTLAPRLASLKGKNIGVLDNAFFKSNSIIVEKLKGSFAEKYGATLISGKTMPWISHDPRNVGKVSDEVLADMVSANLDATIILLGN